MTDDTGSIVESVVLTPQDRTLRLEVGEVTADFHALWLRHNVDEDRHPVTRERVVDSSALADDVRVVEAFVDAGAVELRFSDGAASRFTVSWLLDRAYAKNQAPVPALPSDLAPYTVRREAEQPLDALVAQALSTLRHRGAAIVRAGGFGARAEQDTEPLVDAFAAAGLVVVPTHFGRIEDLRPDNTTNPNNDQLGYTDAALEPHTDQPFLPVPPRYQVLQAIRPAAVGGDNFLVDAVAAARFLKRTDSDVYRWITTQTVRFHRRQRAFEAIVEAPILNPLGPTGFQVRFSPFTMAPHHLPFEDMEPWYRAYNRFARLVRDPARQLRFRLERGDFVIYDNHRMLHGRTAFEGSRWLRGIYFNEAASAASSSSESKTTAANVTGVSLRAQ